ncbi:MAG: M20 family metallopeptidase [Clostridiales bacterium]|nr:M20 family metallopeptidase [Clostridiales bacterium]
MNKFDIEDYIKELEELVNIDSGTSNIEGVNRIADLFEEKYNSINWNVKRHRFDDSVGDCLEITNGKRDNYDVLLIGHMDTVFPEGTVRKRPFKREGNYGYGPGVIDMKSGLLSAYYAMKELNKKVTDISICIAQNSDEEIGSKYSRVWLEKLALKSKYVLVLEAGRVNGALVSERKGVGGYDITFKGRASHAGTAHEEGINAIVELGYWIERLNDLTDYDVGTTVNIGTVMGGIATNVVPDSAFASIDYRVTDMKEVSRIEDKIQYLLQNPKVEGIEVEVTGGLGRPPMTPSKETLELCKMVGRVGKNLGMSIKWASSGGGSDANFTAALGIPSIDGLGPIGGKGHSVDEYILLDSVEPRIELVKGIIAEIAKNA